MDDGIMIDGRTSSYSFSNGNCAEVGSGGSLVAVRDTKQDGAGPVLRFTPAAWARFTAAVKEDRAAGG